MRVQILGCSGGIGGSTQRTTSLLVDHDILIDAGTGAADLSLQALAQIDHVFITHSHLDHIACLPFILDSVGAMRSSPLTMYATRETQEIIRMHIFNWSIWPDFSQIPDEQNPYLRFHTITLGEPVVLSGRSITALPANHTVPAVGYHLDSGTASLVFSGDTTVCDALWQAINRIGNMRTLIIEAAFPNCERILAVQAKHLCPSLLGSELAKLERKPEIFVTHSKPGQFEQIMRELEEIAGAHKLQMLRNDQVFEF